MEADHQSSEASELSGTQLTLTCSTAGWEYELGRGEKLLAQRHCRLASEAFKAAEAAGACADHCSGRRWLAAMFSGHFEAAWNESDLIQARGHADKNRLWNGEKLSGSRIIVRCLHGLGDAVQMLRYASCLQRIASHVIYEVPPALLHLAPLFAGVSEVITWGDEAPTSPPKWDLQIEIMELPHLFRTAMLDLPIAAHYLEVEEHQIRATASAMGVTSRLRVGVVWTGGEWNLDRALPFTLLMKLIDVEKVEFWSLQGGSAAHEAQPWIDRGLLQDASEICGRGLVPLAATIRNLDLVITVDTLAAHLAGALGKPVWVMLQYAADWRWMIEREDSPWYPSMRIFRQDKAGNWAGVVGAVQSALQSAARQKFEETQ